MRKYFGVVLGVVLSIVIGGSALADSIGYNQVTNITKGWNSPIWPAHVAGTTYFKIKECRSSSSTLRFDLMHHWPFWPSTGIGEKSITCSTSTTPRQISWSTQKDVDYSVEYRSTYTATFKYRIEWPG